MKKIKIIKNGTVTHQNAAEDQSDAEKDAWLVKQIAENSFGLPERWLQGAILSDADKALAVETRTSVGSLGEEIVEYKFAAEYSVVEEDLTAEIAAKDSRIQALRAQLQTLKDFDVDSATLAQMKPFLKLQRSILLKIAQILKGSIEGAE